MENTNEKRLSLWEKFSYGMGNFGGNTALGLVTSFFLYFCTDSLGLSAAIMGTLLMVTKLMDGISDVLMGYIINITHSKLGKARFWVILSAVPYGLTTFLLFYMPAFLKGNASYVYLFIVYAMQSVLFYTMYNVSAATLTALATKNKDDRYQMATYLNILGILPVLILSFVTTNMVEFFGGGQRGWAITAFICGLVSALTILWCGIVVKELPEECLEKTDEVTEKLNFVESVKILAQNKYFWILLGIYLATYTYAGVQGAAGVYYCSYILNDVSAFGWLTVAMYGPLFVLLPICVKIIGKVGARKANIIGALLSLAGALVAFINPHSMILVVVACFVVTVGMLPGYATLTPLTADVAEYTKKKTGKDITPIFFSCSSVGIKVGMGLGTAIAGALLSAFGYDGMAEVQSSTALHGIILTYLVPPIIGAILISVLFYFFKLDKAMKALDA